MAGQDDLINIVMNVVGQDKVDQARRAIEQEEEAIRQFAAQLKAGTITQDQFTAAATRSAAAIRGSQQAIKAAGRGFNPQSLLEFSRAAEDAQYGIAGVVNNIPGLVASFGGGAGIVGAASLAAIGIAQLVKNWDALAAAFGAGKTRSEAEEMKDLGDQTARTADEQQRLNTLKARESAGQALETGRPEAETRASAAALKAITEADSIELRRSIRDKAPELIADDPELAAARKALAENTAYIAGRRQLAADSTDEGQRDRAGRDVADAEARRGGLQDAFAAAQEKAAREFLKSASLDAGARNKLIAAINRDAEAFGPKAGELARGLRAAGEIKDPEERKEEEFHARRDADEESRLNKAKYDAWLKDEEEDRKAQEHLEKEQQDGARKLADWQFREQQRIDEEDQAAAVADAVGFDRRRREDRRRTARVFDGPASFRDSIQQSIGIDNTRDDRTAAESLAELREIKTFVKRTAEQRVDRTARAG